MGKASPRTSLEGGLRVYLLSALRLLPAACCLRLHGTVEAGDVFRRVEASGVVVLVCDDPGGTAGGR